MIFSVFHKRTYSILQSAVKDDHLMTPSREPLVKAAEIPDYFLEPLFLVPDCDAWIDRLSPNSYYNRWEEGPRRSLQTPNKCKRFWAQLHFTICQNEFKLKVLKTNFTFVQKLRVLNQIFSKSVGAKLVFLKICGCSCTHCTHTNEGPGTNRKVPFDIALFSLCCGWKLLLNCFFSDVASLEFSNFLL